MQHASGMLLAAGLDGGHTFIFIPKGMKMQIESVTQLYTDAMEFFSMAFLFLALLRNLSYNLSRIIPGLGIL